MVHAGTFLLSSKLWVELTCTTGLNKRRCARPSTAVHLGEQRAQRRPLGDIISAHHMYCLYLII